MGIFALAITMFPVQLVHADIIFTLASDTLSDVRGGVVVFDGTLTNSGTDDVFLNGVVSFISSPDLTVDDQPFFLNTPLFLPPNGGTFTGELFDVAISSAAAIGAYTGSFTIQGGADAEAFDSLATANFSVEVVSASQIPEPSTIILLTTMGLLLGGFVGVRRIGPA
jgi:hypothetical protein